MDNKYIYIVITQTGTILSRILKLLTGAKYNHASLSLSPDLKCMYSFGRINPYNPFWAGFITEAPCEGTYKRFRKTDAMVLAIEIDAENYDNLCKTIEDMLSERQKYHYNYKGLFLAALKIHSHSEHRYYCSEFVKELVQKYNVEGSENLADIVQPIHFLSLPHKVVYHGKINEYI